MSRKIWLIVLCGGAIMGIALGLRQCLGLFLEPISMELGIGRGRFALALGLMNLVWGLAAPVTGALSDRFGAGKVAAAGGLCYAAGLAVLTASGEGGQLILGGVLIGFGLSGAGFSVILGAVGRAAPLELRGRALGTVSMVGSIGQFVMLPYTHLTIELFGWVASLVILAATASLIAPLSAGVADRSPATGALPAGGFRPALAEACGEQGFWLLTAGFFVCGFHLAFVAVHLPAYLADLGFTPWLAVAALAAVGLFNIAGSYAWGALGDRYPKKKLLSVLYLARSAVFLVFLVTPVSEFSVLAFGAVMGLLWLGTVPLTSGLVATIFGTAHLSMLFGIVFLGHQLGGFLGAWVAGLAYDAFGSYAAMWWASVALGILSAALHWPIAERPLPGWDAVAQTA